MMGEGRWIGGGGLGRPLERDFKFKFRFKFEIGIGSRRLQLSRGCGKGDKGAMDGRNEWHLDLWTTAIHPSCTHGPWITVHRAFIVCHTGGRGDSGNSAINVYDKVVVLISNLKEDELGYGIGKGGLN
ncbi:hypothetical protein AMTR_s00028p00236630 [Amborella trichopoda]|uniref:Uncharacterized protein n=1 Tax=Amborella trichopoda TaxID=13333 RepID=W1PL09_AMBTC|nr:hypothetical protein AMTR_s00028p00236630 [Amborella trichopoda]